MSSSLYTEKEIKQMIKDTVKAALKDQKEAHEETIQKLVNGHNLATPPSPRLLDCHIIQWGESLPHLLQQCLGHPCQSLLVPLLHLLVVVPNLQAPRITSTLFPSVNLKLKRT